MYGTHTSQQQIIVTSDVTNKKVDFPNPEQTPYCNVASLNRPYFLMVQSDRVKSQLLLVYCQQLQREQLLDLCLLDIHITRVETKHSA